MKRSYLVRYLPGSAMSVMFHMLVLFALLAQSRASAQSIDSALARKGIVATRIQHGAPRLDGLLDDEAWRNARFVSDFLQKEPNEGAPPSERTEVAFLYDDDALYFGARMYSRNPDNIHAIVTRRDYPGASERIIVTLDTYRDRRTAYSFSLTAAGVRIDYYHPNDFEFSRDYSFDAVWEGETTIDSLGWIAEMRLPFSQLRFNDQEEQVWGINMNRYIPSKNEDIYWIPIPKDGTGWSSRFAELRGIAGIRPSLRLEVLPYVASGARFTGQRDPLDPFDDGRNLTPRAGLDLKMGLSSNLTLDATVNPDFGQVEADPAQVNLSAFETIFDERRPFFVEGSQLLRGIGPGYFYSRRIGAVPHGRVSADFFDYPASTTILGAAKMTGRLASGLSIGSLAAITRREYAETFDLPTQVTGRAEVEPLSGFGVARVQQEFGADASTIGGMVTAVHRDFSGGSGLAHLLPRNAITGGADWNIRFNEGEYALMGHLGGSYITGDSAAIAIIQRSSAHYFQRPDATHVTFDPARTSLAGVTGSLALERQSGEHWLWRLATWFDSPGFDLNDAGQTREADWVNALGKLEYRETKPGDIFHFYAATFFIDFDWNTELVPRAKRYEVDLNVTWKNFWSTSLGAALNDRAYSLTATRGGPLVGNGRVGHVWGSTSNAYGSSIRWTVGGAVDWEEIGGENYFWHGDLAMNLGDRWEVSIGPRYTITNDARQYVTTRDGGRSETYGRRYIFSAIDQSVLSAQLRLRYAVTPDMSLEIYAEPFVASGHYHDFGELVAPRSRDLRLYGTDGTSITRHDDAYRLVDGSDTVEFSNPDYNVGSFRSNFVLRWEWRPGSTFYLVWQQDRGTFDGRGMRVRPDDLWDVITARGDNFLTLKASYWFGVD